MRGLWRSGAGSPRVRGYAALRRGYIVARCCGGPRGSGPMRGLWRSGAGRPGCAGGARPCGGGCIAARGTGDAEARGLAAARVRRGCAALRRGLRCGAALRRPQEERGRMRGLLRSGVAWVRRGCGPCGCLRGSEGRRAALGGGGGRGRAFGGMGGGLRSQSLAVGDWAAEPRGGGRRWHGRGRGPDGMRPCGRRQIKGNISLSKRWKG